MENNYVQLMILMASDKLKDCLWNVDRIYQKINQDYENFIENHKTKEKGNLSGINKDFTD